MSDNSPQEWITRIRDHTNNMVSVTTGCQFELRQQSIVTDAITRPLSPGTVYLQCSNRMDLSQFLSRNTQKVNSQLLPFPGIQESQARLDRCFLTPSCHNLSDSLSRTLGWGRARGVIGPHMDAGEQQPKADLGVLYPCFSLFCSSLTASSPFITPS